MAAIDPMDPEILDGLESLEVLGAVSSKLIGVRIAGKDICRPLAGRLIAVTHLWIQVLQS